VDTAFSADIFDKDHIRVSNPGADDNAAATSTLLKAALVLKNLNLETDVWFLHLTGEEYPLAGLGCRHIMTNWLSKNISIKGFVLLDMMSFVWHKKDKIFQINPGNSEESLKLAKIAWEVSKIYSPSLSLEPKFRSRWDNMSYLYNTDGGLISDIGYPIVYINEHINYLQNFDRPCYHESCDLSKTLDLDYGVTLLKIAIETVAQISIY